MNESLIAGMLVSGVIAHGLVTEAMKGTHPNGVAMDKVDPRIPNSARAVAYLCAWFFGPVVIAGFVSYGLYKVLWFVGRHVGRWTLWLFVAVFVHGRPFVWIADGISFWWRRMRGYPTKVEQESPPEDGPFR